MSVIVWMSRGLPFIRAILRRPPVVGYKTITVRDIELDPVEHSVKMAGSELKLYPKEFSLRTLNLCAVQTASIVVIIECAFHEAF